MIKYSIVVPLYNEELVIAETYKRLTEVMQKPGEDYELIFVNDGSRDKTENMVREIAEHDPHVRLISFSRNFGHQIAITAGMDNSSGQAVVVIDADLQDPPELIPQMLAKWREGYDVVYGKRLKRKGETAFKKITSKTFYRFLNGVTEVEMPVDVGDFRLIDRKVCDALKKIHEKNRYIRGIISWLGFKQTSVEYNRSERFAGETKYPFKKMLRLAVNGITSFSTKPLRISSYFGMFISFVSFAYLIIVLIQGLFGNTAQWGWASIMAVILFTNGIILIILGIIGEYVGRIYEEAKNRPLYVIRDLINFEAEENKNDHPN